MMRRCCLVALPFHSIHTQGTKRTGAYYVQSDFYDYRLRWSTVMTIAMTTTITMPAAWALALQSRREVSIPKVLRVEYPWCVTCVRRWATPRTGQRLWVSKEKIGLIGLEGSTVGLQIQVMRLQVLIHRQVFLISRHFHQGVNWPLHMIILQHHPLFDLRVQLLKSCFVVIMEIISQHCRVTCATAMWSQSFTWPY